jgi:hypothetical protein
MSIDNRNYIGQVGYSYLRRDVLERVEYRLNLRTTPSQMRYLSVNAVKLALHNGNLIGEPLNGRGRIRARLHLVHGVSPVPRSGPAKVLVSWESRWPSRPMLWFESRSPA